MSSAPPRPVRSAAKSSNEIVTVEAEISKLLGPPPLIAGETAEDYETFYDSLRSMISPTDPLEELWVRDIVDLSWEILRFRRLKPRLMVKARTQVMRDLLKRVAHVPFDQEKHDALLDEDGDEDEEAQIEFCEEHTARENSHRANLLHRWLSGDAETTEEVRKLLKRIGYDFDVVEAEAFSLALDDIERFDRLIAQANDRRNARLREIERHRDGLAKRLRRGVADIEDAEFEDVAFVAAGEAAE